MRRLSPTTLDFGFRVAVTIKGIDGILEVLGGVALLILPRAWLMDLIQHFDPQLGQQVWLLAVLYLLINGVVKLAVVTALLTRRYWLYPYAILVLVAFTAYQGYLTATRHSWLTAILGLLDAIVAVLTYWEYRRHQP